MPESVEKLCSICGKPVPKGRLVYCSEACAAEGERRLARRESEQRQPVGVWQVKECIDCGKTFRGHIRSPRCPDCAAARQRENDRQYKARLKAGRARPLGSNDICVKCGKPYVVKSGTQRYCSDCAPEEVAANKRASARAWNAENRESLTELKRLQHGVQRVCSVCGKSFDSGKTYRKFCSDECRKAAARERDRERRRHRKDE